MNIQLKVANWAINNANELINFLGLIPWPILLFIPFLTTIFWLTGGMLSRVAKPENPKASPVIREAGIWMNTFALIAIAFSSIYIFTIFSLVFVGFSLQDQFQGHGFLYLLRWTTFAFWSSTKEFMLLIIAGSSAGISLSIYLNYFMIAEWARGEGLHDVNDIAAEFQKLNGFNPLPYIDISKGCFIGLDSSESPIYIPWKKLRETHIQVIGTTGSGKGVIMTLIAYQCILSGEGLVWMDPKLDRFSPRIIEDAARLANKDFHFINLNADQPPQFNLIAGASVHDIEELLVAGFGLVDKGSDGDFHRGKDEDAAILAARLAISNNALTLNDLFRVCNKEEAVREQENFWRKLTKLCSITPLRTKEGPNLVDLIQKRSVIYFVGSTYNKQVKIFQKMVLARINQIIMKEDRSKNNLPLLQVLDEFKNILSPTNLSALGAIRDFNVHSLLAHQSIGDLSACPDISRAEAESAVLDNTAIKIVYKIGDSDYAEKLSKLSGKKPIFKEQASKNINDQNQSVGGWQEAHAYLIDTDVITHLPMPSDREGQASVGVLFGVGVAKIFHVGPVPAFGEMPGTKAVLEDEDISAIIAGGTI